MKTVVMCVMAIGCLQVAAEARPSRCGPFGAFGPKCKYNEASVVHRSLGPYGPHRTPSADHWPSPQKRGLVNAGELKGTNAETSGLTSKRIKISAAHRSIGPYGPTRTSSGGWPSMPKRGLAKVAKLKDTSAENWFQH